MNTDYGNWAYRGNDYEVTWISAHGSSNVNSVVVTDLMTGDTIPYKPYRNSAPTVTLADGWCFQSSAQATDTLVYDGPGFGTRTLYICGGWITLKSGNWLEPGDPRPGNETWTVYASTGYMPAPANARVSVTPTPAAYGTDEVVLNVKVVPNPYLIHSEWQQTFAQRRLRFINLPSSCTVRIFNLNGELVRTIVHHHTLGVDEGDTPVSGSAGGDEWWDLLSENRQLVASGVYIFHVQSDVGEQVGKFVVIR
jgi:hypothetical protein